MGNFTGILIPANINDQATIHQGLTFEEAKELMGADLAQIHYLPEDNSQTFWADEEALVKGNPQLNHRATELIRLDSGMYHPVVGPVFISGGADEQGNTLPLAPHVMGKIMAELDKTPKQWLEVVRALNKEHARTMQF